jgi:hypothetical protein
MTDVTPAAPAPDADPPETLERTGCILYQLPNLVHLDRPVPWVWDGYLARHQITLLTGQWKIGKTTLLAALLGRLGDGGELCGRPVRAGRAAVVTEEGVNLWLPRRAKYGIGEHVWFAFEPYRVKPVPRQWGFLVEDLADLHRRRALDLVVIDPLAAMLPGGEEGNAAAMTDALRPVRELAAGGPAVLLVHHPRNGTAPGGQGARGTGALPAFVDVLMEMHWAGPAGDDNRRRRLLAWSRHEATPRRLLVELSADGTNYAMVEEDEPATAEVVRTVLAVVGSAPGLSAAEVAARWPADGPVRSERSVGRWLAELTLEGRLRRRGRGHRFSPYRYELPATNGAGEPAGDSHAGIPAAGCDADSVAAAVDGSARPRERLAATGCDLQTLADFAGDGSEPRRGGTASGDAA